MRINSIDNNKNSNIILQGLYVTPKTLKKIGCTREMLINNPSIKDCSSKYDVMVTAGKKKYVINRHDGFTKDKYLPAAYLISTILSVPYIGEWLTAIGINNIETYIGACLGIAALAGLSIIKLCSRMLNEICVIGASKIKESDKETFNPIYYDEFETKGATSQTYTVRRDSDGIIKNIPNLTETIRNAEYKRFYYDVLNKANLNDMATPKKYLAELQKIKDTANEFYISDVFKFPINKGGDTLLTVFFDIAIPNKNNTEEMVAYYNILSEISKTDKNNFNQKDAKGVTILEKVINSENEYVLPLIKNCQFSYSPYLKNSYDNIHNDFFKNQLKQTIDFNFDLLENK